MSPKLALPRQLMAPAKDGEEGVDQCRLQTDISNRLKGLVPEQDQSAFLN